MADEARAITRAHLAATHNVARAEWPLAAVAVSLSEKYHAYANFAAAPTGAGIYSQVVRTRTPLRLGFDALVQHPNWRGFSHYRQDHPALNGLIAVPLTGFGGQSIGVVMVSDKIEGDFTPDDEAVLGHLAQIASVSIENALALDALHRSERRLRATHDNANLAIGECDQTGRFTEVNRGFCAISGYERDELLNMSLFDLTHPEDAAGERPVFQKHVSGELPHYSLDKRYIRKDGATVWVHVAASGVFDEKGSFAYGIRVVQDITERKTAEARQNLLLRELHHRVKNTLATVQAIAGSTIRSSADMEQFRTAFTDRLVSLGKTHTLLTEGAWAGISLIQLLRLELDPFDDQSTHRIMLTGDDVLLSPQAAVPLGMAFHELTTNAVKYGALSALGGSIEVKWEFDTRSSRLHLIWQERNGPPVARPSRRGFGSQLLERVLGPQLKGKVATHYWPGGLCVVVEGEVGVLS